MSCCITCEHIKKVNHKKYGMYHKCKLLNIKLQNRLTDKWKPDILNWSCTYWEHQSKSLQAV